MKKVYEYLKVLSETKTDDRAFFLETLKMKNYADVELSEQDMWVLTNASQDDEYMQIKLKEADELSLDTEAPSETGEELSLDTPSEETPTETDATEKLTLAAPAEETPTETDGEELSLDTPSEETPTETDGEELSLDAPSEETPTETDADGDADGDASEEPKKEVETSKEGIGILPLLGEIQDKLANGKPSEVELAALKAIKKLVG